MAMVVVKCDTCGKDVRKHDSRVSEHNFCNRTCYLKFHMVDKPLSTCQYCGKQFRPVNDYNASIFCSRECYNISHNIENKNRECPTCKKQFEAKTSEDKYCSLDCYNQDRHMPTGEEHWNWKGGKNEERDSSKSKQWRLAVYKKSDYTCQKCGHKENLNAHHIYSWASYENLRFEVSNGITLCEECHKAIHKKFGYHSKEKMIL